MGNACTANVSEAALQGLNHGLPLNDSIKVLPKMALVERGSCLWQTKMDTVVTTSSHSNLNIDSMMLYDNDTHGLTDPFWLQSLQQADTDPYNDPTSPLPADRNASQMPDNNLGQVSNGSVAISIYFVPFAYGDYLRNGNKTDAMAQAGLASANATNIEMFYQIVPLFTSNPWQNGGNSLGNWWTASRSYLAYIIALMLLFFVTVVLLRWWRIRKMREEVALQDTARENYMLQQRVHDPDPLPFAVVQCIPITIYSVENVKNACCAICLDDFVENKSEVRLLPCHHGFCQTCIDPWLTQKSSFCPICKCDCLPPELREQRNRELAQAATSSSHMQARETIVDIDTPPASIIEEDMLDQALPSTSTANAATESSASQPRNGTRPRSRST
ncbi:hypothetical protein BC940DRAFT_291637 [Gongronella butleri]|nr:hypothetical protein BC940DRAFT_291637 [Gongronella butleri]